MDRDELHTRFSDMTPNNTSVFFFFLFQNILYKNNYLNCFLTTKSHVYVESDVISSKLSFYVIYVRSRCNVAPIWFSIYHIMLTHQQCFSYFFPSSLCYPSCILHNIQNICGDTEKKTWRSLKKWKKKKKKSFGLLWEMLLLEAH